MRTIALIVLSLLPLTVTAQKDAVYATYPKDVYVSKYKLPENSHGDIEYSDVVHVDSANSLQLYSRAQDFLIHSIFSKKYATQLDDKDERKIIVKENFDVDFMIRAFISGRTYATIYVIFEIQCKDGRYKYTMNHFQYELPQMLEGVQFELLNGNQTGKHLNRATWDNLHEAVDKRVKSILAALKQSMSHPTDDQW